MPTNSVNPVFEKVCLFSGHSIVPTNPVDVFDIGLKKVVQRDNGFCIKCGMPLDEIRSYKEIKRRTRGPNKTNGGVIPNGRENATLK